MNTYQSEKNKLYKYLGESLVNTFKKYKVCVAGGTITSLFSGSEINDIDLYFKNDTHLVNTLKELGKLNKINFITNKSISMLVDEKPLQLIYFKYFPNTENIFNTFDFTVCMGAFDFSSESFILHNDFMQHNSQRILKFNKDTDFPIISLLRTKKYSDKGYTISKAELMRVALACVKIDSNNLNTLNDQLGGMYGDDGLFDLINDNSDIDSISDKISQEQDDADLFLESDEKEYDLDQAISRVLGSNAYCEIFD